MPFGKITTMARVDDSMSDDSYIALDVSPSPEVISALRHFIEEYLERTVHDADITARVTMAAHELLENAIQGSIGPRIDLRMGITVRNPDIRVIIETKNEALRDEHDVARALIDELSNAVDANDQYLDLMKRSLARKQGSGLGLGRIRSEAQMSLTCAMAGKFTTIRAIGHYVRTEKE
jgi:hypothetical protein